MRFSILIGALIVLISFGCNDEPKENVTAGTPGSVRVLKDWKLGVQLWTFHRFPFVTAIEKSDSAGIRYIEAFPGQLVGGDMKDTFGITMSPDSRKKVLDLLRSKEITLVAFGVVVPQTTDEWRKTFQFAKEMGIQFITAEPLKNHWDSVDRMAGEFGIKVAIHDHPKPSPYDHPDSVITAMNGRPNLYACADVGHWARNGLDVVECLKKLQGRIIGVHLKDIKTFDKTDAEDVRLGAGVIKFPEVFAELKRQNFKGMLSIENESNWDNNVPDVIHNREYFEQQVGKVK